MGPRALIDPRKRRSEKICSRWSARPPPRPLFHNWAHPRHRPDAAPGAKRARSAPRSVGPAVPPGAQNPNLNCSPAPGTSVLPEAPSASGRRARPVLDARGPLCGVGILRLRGGGAGAIITRVTSSRQHCCGPSPSIRPRWEVAHALWHMCNKPYPGRRRCPVANCLLARLPGWGWSPRAPGARSVSFQSALGPAIISPDVKNVPGTQKFHGSARGR